MPRPSPLKELGYVLRTLRLSRTAQTYLRRRVKGYGDVSRLVNEAAFFVDLEEVPVLPRLKSRGVVAADLVSRTIAFDPMALEAFRSSAEARGVSLNVLVDAALIAYLAPAKPVGKT